VCCGSSYIETAGVLTTASTCSLGFNWLLLLLSITKEDRRINERQKIEDDALQDHRVGVNRVEKMCTLYKTWANVHLSCLLDPEFEVADEAKRPQHPPPTKNRRINEGMNESTAVVIAIVEITVLA